MDTKRHPRHTALTLIAAYLGLFVGLVDANAINLALPAVRDDLGGGISGAQWTIDAYNVTFAAVLLSSGLLGDRFGRRTLLRIGLIAFVTASLACAAAPTLPVLLTARAVQGVGAGLMLPQGLAIAAAAFPDAIGRARATGAWAAAAATSTALGPILGGVLTDSVGWRYIFWLNRAADDVPLSARIARSGCGAHRRTRPAAGGPGPGHADHRARRRPHHDCGVGHYARLTRGGMPCRFRLDPTPRVAPDGPAGADAQP
jgi:MFS family permease